MDGETCFFFSTSPCAGFDRRGCIVLSPRRCRRRSCTIVMSTARLEMNRLDLATRARFFAGGRPIEPRQAARRETRRRCSPNFVPPKRWGEAIIYDLPRCAILLARNFDSNFRTAYPSDHDVIPSRSLFVVLFQLCIDRGTESRRYGPGLLVDCFSLRRFADAESSFAREQSKKRLTLCEWRPIAPFADSTRQDAGKVCFSAGCARQFSFLFFAFGPCLYNVSFDGWRGG